MGNLKFGNNAPLALYMGVSGATKAYYGTEVVFGGDLPIDYSTLYTTMEILTGGTINWTEIGGSTVGAELSYSLNDGDWTALPTGSTINVSAGDKVRFKGNNPTYSNTLNRNAGCTFNGSTAYFNLYGNIMSLIYGDNFEGQTSVSSEYTFKNMFFATSVVNAENLVLVKGTIQKRSYAQMFLNCASLITAPQLPSTTLAESCYDNMFNGCTSLTIAPELPATTLANYCYRSMFQGCTSLTTSPELPATTLANYCYRSMFQGCTSLTTAPELPAMTLTTNCYYQMFQGCTSLTTAPALPAETLADSCYYQMFSGCTNLNSIKCLATDISATNCILDWLSDVSSSGTFEGYSSAGYLSGGSGVPSGWNFVDFTPNYPQEYFTLEAFSSGEITYENTTTGFTADMSYSLNESEWTPLTNGDSIAVSGRDKVRFKGVNARLAESSSNRTRFGSSAIIDVYGNIMSLVSGDSFSDATIDTTSNRVFGSLFIDNKKLRNAENLVLPSNVGSFTYNSMFSGCSSLTAAPSLPATTLSDYCYQSMFLGCSSLTTAPELPATTLTSYCYQSMFQGCTSLNYVKCLATDISASYCLDNWLDGVSSSGTFEGYSSAGYPSGGSGVPSGWSFDALDAPDYSQKYFTLEAFSSGEITYENTTIGFTADMSYSLNESEWTPLTNGDSIAVSEGDKVRFKGVNALLAESSSNRTRFGSSAIIDVYGNIMSLISGDTFYDATIDTTLKRVFGSLFIDNKKLRNAENLVLPSNVGSLTYNGMFKNCSSLETAPKLPAMEMKASCYFQMFSGCSSLTAAPELPATTLASSCYNSMFSGCTNLSSIKCLATNISASNCLNNWLSNVAASGTFEGYSSAGYMAGTSGIPEGWTFVEAT